METVFLSRVIFLSDKKAFIHAYKRLKALVLFKPRPDSLSFHNAIFFRYSFYLCRAMEHLRKKLAERENLNALRALPAINAHLIDFCSNDYLGLSRKPPTHKQLPSGATGSRLLSGNHPIHEQAENLIAQHHSAESALLFNSGYVANIGLIDAITNRNHIILYDELVHASIRDGLRLSLAKSHSFKHNQVNDLTKKLAQFPEQQKWVITESVFSMDGDEAPLKAISEICQHHQTPLIVDEAHAIGVFGKNGSGLVNELGLCDEIFARVITFGKALGAHGAAILGSQLLKNYLINFCRSFIYTTALPPSGIAHLMSCYDYLNDSDAQNQLQANINLFKQLINVKGQLISSRSAIQSIIFPGNEFVKKVAKQITEAGFDVKAILSPTVPKGKERIRICLHSFNTPEQINLLTQLLHKIE